MCPDREILSAYFDGELGYQWEKKIRDHLSTCAACRRRIDDFGRLRQMLKVPRVPQLDEARNRVWGRIQAERVAMPPLGFWKRRIILPAPVFATAMAVMAILIVASVLFNIGYVDHAVARNPSIETEPMAIQVETVEELIRFIESQNAYVEVNLQIPDGSTFYIFGEPQFLRETEYNGSRGFRN